MLPPTAEQTDCVLWENLGLADADLLHYVGYIATAFLPNSGIRDFSTRVHHSY